MNMPKVSVIIPVYNGEKTLGRCLDSILDQAYGNYEVVVVDNSSTDTTREIISIFEEKTGTVKYVFEPKRGRGVARNAGIEAAAGDIIAMTDGDCIVPQNWLEELIKPILHENEDAVMGFEEDLIDNYWTRNIQKANRDFFQKSCKGNYVVDIDTKNFAVKTSIIKEIMFDPAMRGLEDVELAVRLEGVLKIRFLPSLVVGHNHKNTFLDVVRLNVDRAYWAARILKKYKGRLSLAHTVMLEGIAKSISVKGFILFPFWIISQFMKKPIGEAFFILVSGASWRLGIVWSMIA